MDLWRGPCRNVSSCLAAWTYREIRTVGGMVASHADQMKEIRRNQTGRDGPGLDPTSHPKPERAGTEKYNIIKVFDRINITQVRVGAMCLTGHQVLGYMVYRRDRVHRIQMWECTGQNGQKSQ